MQSRRLQPRNALARRVAALFVLPSDGFAFELIFKGHGQDLGAGLPFPIEFATHRVTLDATYACEFE